MNGDAHPISAGDQRWRYHSIFGRLVEGGMTDAPIQVHRRPNRSEDLARDTTLSIGTHGRDTYLQPKKTSASSYSSGGTNLSSAVASDKGTRLIEVPCNATIWPMWPPCSASTACRPNLVASTRS